MGLIHMEDLNQAPSVHTAYDMFLVNFVQRRKKKAKESMTFVYGSQSFPCFVADPQEADLMMYDTEIGSGIWHNQNASKLGGEVPVAVTAPIGGTGITSNPLNFTYPVTTKGDLIVGTGSNTVTKLPVSTDSDPLMSDSAATDGVAYHPLFPYKVVGSNPLGSGLNATWYTAEASGTLATPTVNNGTAYAVPVMIRRKCTIDSLGAYCLATGTATAMRCALYADLGGSTPCWPGALLADSGDISVSASTFSYASLGTPVTIEPGLYWLAFMNNSSTASQTAGGSNPGQACNAVLGYIPTQSKLNPVSYLYATQTYGAWPSTFPASYGGGTLAVQNAPYAFYHCSA